MRNNYFVFIPAGSNYEINGVLKHHLNFGDKSILENTIDETLKAGVKVITTVRNSKKIKDIYNDNPDVIVLESKEKLVESCLYGLVEGVINNFYNEKFRGSWNSSREVKKHLKTSPSFENMRIIYAGCDMPFFNEEDITKFISNYEKNEKDLYIAMANMQKLIMMDKKLELCIKDIDSTIDNYCVTDIGDLRIANMYVMNPKKIIDKGLTSVIQLIYDLREISKEKKINQTNITAILGRAYGLSQLIGRITIHPKDTSQIIPEIIHLIKHVKGKDHDKIVNSGKTLSYAEPILGVSIGIDTTCNLRTLIDIDDSNSYSLFLKNKQRIEEYIKIKN